MCCKYVSVICVIYDILSSVTVIAIVNGDYNNYFWLLSLTIKCLSSLAKISKTQHKLNKKQTYVQCWHCWQLVQRQMWQEMSMSKRFDEIHNCHMACCCPQPLFKMINVLTDQQFNREVEEKFGTLNKPNFHINCERLWKMTSDQLTRSEFYFLWNGPRLSMYVLTSSTDSERAPPCVVLRYFTVMDLLHITSSTIISIYCLNKYVQVLDTHIVLFHHIISSSLILNKISSTLNGLEISRHDSQ